jgi:hypothetical protein
VTKGEVIESDFAKAIELCPRVREQLSMDGCARMVFLFLKGNEMESADIHSFQLLLSGESISNGRSPILQSGLFGNVNLERLFLGFSKVDIEKNLSDLVMERRIDLESANVSIKALDSLFLNE